MLKRLILVCAAFVSTLALAVSDGPGTYAATAPLQLVPGEGLQSLSLPWAVVQASRSKDLADVRVFDSQGRALPMAWAQTPSADERTRVVPLPVFAWPESAAAEPVPAHLHLNANGMVLDLQTLSTPAPAAYPVAVARTWLIDLSALKENASGDERGEALHLNWPAGAAGLSAQASLERSEDGQQWQPFASGRLLEFPAGDLHGPASPRLDSLAWPTSSEQMPRYVRLRLDKPLALSSASLGLTQRLAAPALTQALRFDAVSGTSNGEAQWLLDLQARLAPLALAIDLPAGSNTLLNLRLEQRNASNEPWRTVSRFVAWRMQRGGVDGQAPAQPVHAAPARYWRLVAEGPVPSSLQAEALTAQWQWQAPRLVLLAQGEPGFVLAVGRTGQQPAALPLNTLMPAYQSGAEFKLPQASLGELQLRPAKDLAEQLASPEPEAVRRWALWAVLIVAVCGLAWMARGLLRKIGPPDGS